MFLFIRHFLAWRTFWERRLVSESVAKAHITKLKLAGALKGTQLCQRSTKRSAHWALAGVESVAG